MAKDIQFECCYERPEKGIYMEVHEGGKCLEFNIYADFKAGVGVCLRKDDVERLIDLLQDSLPTL